MHSFCRTDICVSAAEKLWGWSLVQWIVITFSAFGINNWQRNFWTYCFVLNIMEKIRLTLPAMCEKQAMTQDKAYKTVSVKRNGEAMCLIDFWYSEIIWL